MDVAAVQAAGDRAGLQQLLAVLGYDTVEPVEQTAASLGVAERFQHLIRSVHRVAAERLAPGLPPALEVYCFETTTQTVELRKALAAAFRNKPANTLLIVATREFDPLDLVLVERAVQADRAAHGQGCRRSTEKVVDQRPIAPVLPNSIS